MRLLLFLLLGTLIFGFAFPAVIMFAGIFIFILVAIMAFNMIRSGGTYVFMRGRRARSPFEDEQGVYREHSDFEDKSETSGNVATEESDNDDFGQKTEVIELPPSALRKDEDDK